ncbi:MAG: hypothetical protein WCX95_03000 [Candidatus Gracilibacteria bacterium]
MTERTDSQTQSSDQYDEDQYYKAVDQLVAAMDPANPSPETIPQSVIDSMPHYVWTELYHTMLPRAQYPEPIARALGKLVETLPRTKIASIPFSDPEAPENHHFTPYYQPTPREKIATPPDTKETRGKIRRTLEFPDL